ncbi:MAG: hypothetical protein CMO80_03460 [Verrucomicrobiales bacterium]|nr:hypothetical protein [Verrucomicrobiales bacterium]
MMVFDQLIGGGDSNAMPVFPFVLIALPDKEAISTYFELRDSISGEVPVMIGNFESATALHKGVAYIRYGARIWAMTHDTVECIVENPPTTRDEAITLTEEQFMYSSEIVHEGVGTISNLPATLINARHRHFWWE